MRDFTQRLISEEFRAGDPADSEGRAAFRVCEKLRLPLSTLAGAAGFRSLLARAVTLARAEVSWLDGLKVNLDGSFEFPAEMKGQLDGADSAKGGEALITKLLGLLITFIGEALTLRLVHDVWPKAALKNSKSGKDSP